MFITYEILTTAGACRAQRDTFQMYFPVGVHVSPALAEAVADHFDWEWAATNLLSPNGYDYYESETNAAYAAYDTAVSKAAEAFNEKEADLRNQRRGGELTYDEWEKQDEANWHARSAAMGPLVAEWRKAKARAFAEAATTYPNPTYFPVDTVANPEKPDKGAV